MVGLSPMFSNTLILPTLTTQTAILEILDSVSNNSFFENNEIFIDHFLYLYLSYTSINLEKRNS